MTPEAEAIAAELEEPYRLVQRPFPYQECWVIRRLIGAEDLDLNPDLDLFFSNIDGYSSDARRLDRRRPVQLLEAPRSLARPFYEVYPEHLNLRPLITLEQTPRLYADMCLHELMRQKLLQLLPLILAEKGMQAPG